MRNEVKDRYDRYGRKLFSTMGPEHIYQNLALLTFYTPYWRKICRMLNMARRCHLDFKGDYRLRQEAYLRAAMKDTKLPWLVKWLLEACIEEEFKIKL